MKETNCFRCYRYARCHEHHLLPGINRQKADKYRLTVYLCPTCHSAIHNNPNEMKVYRQIGQTRWMREQGKTIEDFIKEFGKNYL